VYSANVPSTTTVSWDTERLFEGFVAVSENGGDEYPLPGQLAAGQRSGSLPLEVKLGITYRLSLKRGGLAGVEVASAFVTTFDLRMQLAEGFSTSYLPHLRPQLITHLVVKPGIDTVSISFRTTRPSIPTTEIRDASGAYVDGRLPLLGGLRTRHVAVFGLERPLALNQKHSFKIEAFGRTGNKSSPNKAVVTGEFVTGVRNVDVMFETLDMHDDGDPDPRGAGEFMIGFGAGDAETGVLLGKPCWWPDHGRGNISDEDPPLALDEKINIPGSPRQLWLQVIADESDRTMAPWEMGGIISGMRPTFDRVGSEYRGGESGQRASVTVIADVDTDPGRWMIPFELRTGDYPIDYVVNGHLGVHAIVGEYVAPKVTKSAGLPRSSGYLTDPGSVVSLAVEGVEGSGALVALGSDDIFYYRPVTPDLSSREEGAGWGRLELPGAGAPAVLLAQSGRLDVVDLDERGGVLHCPVDLGRSKAGKWRKLGGAFRHVLPAAEPGKSRGAAPGLLLFGIDNDGAVHVRDAGSDGRDWDRLGDKPLRAVAPASLAGIGTVLFTIDAEGILTYFASRNGRWRMQTVDARVPGDSPVQLLTVIEMSQASSGRRKPASRDLVVGVMREDRQVFILRWTDYPAAAPEPRWQELGTLQDLLVAEEAGPPRRRRKATGKA
jgi:hypothetical protein